MKLKPGVAFSEHIRIEKVPKRGHYQSLYGGYTKHVSIRNFFIVCFTVSLFAILFVKLFVLQVVQGSYYRLLSDKNRTRSTTLHAPRGVIFDRHHTPLVYNTPGFRQVKGKEIILLTKEQALTLLGKGEKNISVDSLRHYPYKEAMAHVLGYIGQITEEDIKQDRYKNYLATDLLGKEGVERVYEEKLKGVDGKKLVEVDAMGEEVRTLGQTDATPGQDITLTLDAVMQEAAYQAMKTASRGAVIVSNSKGEILAMVSKPSFDPNLFTMGKDYKPASDAAYHKLSDVLLDGQTQPLLNRAIGGIYPPASTFKLVTAAAGFENKLIDEHFTVEDTGVLKVGAFSFANWYFTQYGKTEGTVDIKKAIARSNDIYFYKVGDMVGVDRLSAMAREFGLGIKSGIDLDGEASGLVPSKEWKKETLQEQWYLGDNFHYGIGQGFLLTTPLQVNMWTQALANMGTLYRPHVLLHKKSEVINQGFLQKKTVENIRAGMIDSCRQETGVAWPLYGFKVRNPKLTIDGKNVLEVKPSTSSAGLKDIEQYRQIVIACKTGTGQHGGETTLPHAWITLYAPAYDPEIIVTVLNESSGEGSNEAAPIAKKVLEAWFGKTISTN